MPSAAAARATATSASRCAISSTPIGQRTNGLDSGVPRTSMAALPRSRRRGASAGRSASARTRRGSRASSPRCRRRPRRRRSPPADIALRAACSSRSTETGTVGYVAARAADVDLELALAPDPDGHARHPNRVRARIDAHDELPGGEAGARQVGVSLVAARRARRRSSRSSSSRWGSTCSCVRATAGRGSTARRRISRGREFDLLKFRTLRRDVLAAHRLASRTRACTRRTRRT